MLIHILVGDLLGAVGFATALFMMREMSGSEVSWVDMLVALIWPLLLLWVGLCMMLEKVRNLRERRRVPGSS